MYHRTRYPPFPNLAFLHQFCEPILSSHLGSVKEHSICPPYFHSIIVVSFCRKRKNHTPKLRASILLLCSPSASRSLLCTLNDFLRLCNLRLICAVRLPIFDLVLESLESVLDAFAEGWEDVLGFLDSGALDGCQLFWTGGFGRGWVGHSKSEEAVGAA